MEQSSEKSGSIVLHDLTLDELGRVTLPEDLFEEIGHIGFLAVAGSNGGSCNGTINGGCSNGGCSYSSNSYSCSNTTCVGSTNDLRCA